MQVINYDGTVSGKYEVKLHIKEHEICGVYETYKIKDIDIPDGIRCMMYDEFMHEHGVKMIDVADIQWNIIFDDEKECFLELSAVNTKKNIAYSTAMQLELSAKESELLKHFGLLSN